MECGRCGRHAGCEGDCRPLRALTLLAALQLASVALRLPLASSLLRLCSHEVEPNQKLHPLQRWVRAAMGCRLDPDRAAVQLTVALFCPDSLHRHRALLLLHHAPQLARSEVQ